MASQSPAKSADPVSRSEEQSAPDQARDRLPEQTPEFDELVLDAQTARTLKANVRCLVEIADPCTSRLSGIADCRLFRTALGLLVHKLFSAAGANLPAVG